jgi:carbamoyl-phosphate synthase small subunit
LDEYLKRHKIVGIEDIDTRMLTRRLRVKGSLKGVISTEDLDHKSLVKKAKDCPGVEGIDLVKVVTCKEPYVWNDTSYARMTNDKCQMSNECQNPNVKFNVAAYDYGIKFNILRNLMRVGCRVMVYPAAYPAEDILKTDPDGTGRITEIRIRGEAAAHVIALEPKG